ncbi:DUF3108 domain-containing protein [Ottowia sp.]|uniref:DUF3108 domain-containing protein n=1 Tax=Ottowia sp. TaxID=1898956 RepID=UPI003A8C29C4
MARLLNTASWPSGRCALWLSLALTLLLHVLALALLRHALQPPSLLLDMAPAFYTRTITPVAPATPAVVVPAPTDAPPPRRPTAHIRQTPAQPANPPAPIPAEPSSNNATPAAEAPELPKPPASQVAQAIPALSTPPVVAASHPQQPLVDAAASDASASDAQPKDMNRLEATIQAPAATSIAAASAPALAASSPDVAEAEAAFLTTWPSDTRVTYKLGGNYRGPLDGSGYVLWQRVGTRYQATVELSAGLLASLSFNSQGEITPFGLHPEVYEEDFRGRRRGVRLGGDEVQLHRGQRVPRPVGVQDTASQFVDLGHRFATGQVALATGTQIRFSMARPGGVDDWIYDVVGLETLHLPQLGAVSAWHLKPRRLDKPRGPYSAEIWFAPTLQYLPVRIRITQDEDTYIELLVKTIEQQ